MIRLLRRVGKEPRIMWAVGRLTERPWVSEGCAHGRRWIFSHNRVAANEVISIGRFFSSFSSACISSLSSE